MIFELIVMHGASKLKLVAVGGLGGEMHDWTLFSHIAEGYFPGP